MKYDVAVIGGGIVGLATARALLQTHPACRLLVLEKESAWARHQTGRNSGVIHSGIYYKPGSLKARMAVAGNLSMVAFCREHGIRHEVCGKVIVASRDDQTLQLQALFDRAVANGIDVRRLAPEEVREIEPHVRCVGGLHVPGTGIVDYRDVVEELVRSLSERGAELRTSSRVTGWRIARGELTLETTTGAVHAGFAVNCAGLHADRIARLAGADPQATIVPFRGEYYSLEGESRSLVRNLIYPVPDPQFPFLGVHFTRMVSGEVHAGPNAVLSLKREGYRKWQASLRDIASVMACRGFRILARKHWRAGAREIVRSLSRTAFVRSLQELVPEVRSADLVWAEPGVRAQAIAPDGRLVDDFLIVEAEHSLHVCNAPSPAATASLEIGSYIAGRVAEAT